jgi:anti-anti-sigma regulatory factor
MVKANYDGERDILILEFKASVDRAQAEQLSLDIERILSTRAKGFTLLADFSSVDTMEPAVEGEIKKTMQLFKARGVKEILRVLPDPDMELGFNILSRCFYAPDTKTLTFRSRQEADAYLKGKLAS